jgi:hypothetical protein
VAPGTSKRPSVAPKLAYSLVVSRGYVRLVRTGQRSSRRFTPRSFIFRDDWEEVDPQLPPPDRDDKPVDDVNWADEARLDPELQLAMDEALHPRRGDAGQSARSRMNMPPVRLAPLGARRPPPGAGLAHLPRRLATLDPRRPSLGSPPTRVRAALGARVE